MGQVELSMTDPETGQVASEVLQQGLWSRFSERFESRTVYPAKLTFVPKANTNGKKAEFRVKVDAELETNAGSQFVGSSNDISAGIVITNLDPVSYTHLTLPTN